MMRAVIFALLLFRLSAAQGQQAVASTVAHRTMFARFNPLGLADLIDQNLSFGGEYRVNPKWSIAADMAWVFNSRAYENRFAHGMIVRPAVRLFFGHRFRSFVEFELHYKQVTHMMDDWLGQNCVNDVAVYEKYTRFRFRRTAYGAHAKAGKTFTLSAGRRLWMELYSGIGIRQRMVGLPGNKNCCYIDPGNVTGSVIEGASSWTMAIPMGMRLMYRIN